MTLAELTEKPRENVSNHYALPTDFVQTLPENIYQETPLDYALEHDNSLI